MITTRRATRSPQRMWRQIIRDFAASKGIAQREIGDAEILERCIYPMINEGAKILEEGKAQRASDIDIVWIYGYGWPVYRGGPMFYADTIGLKTVLAKLKEFQAKFGDDFKPAALLEKLAAEGGAFSKLDDARPHPALRADLPPRGEGGAPKARRMRAARTEF